MATLMQTSRPTSTPTAAAGSNVAQRDRLWLGASLVAAALLTVACFLPLWTMDLIAPQYPAGLGLEAYGYTMEGDLSEINALNHYVGIKAIEPEDVFELQAFPFAMAAVIGLVAFAGFMPRWRNIPLKWISRALVFIVPLAFLIDLQWWLYRYGHDLDRSAPLRIPEFTPRVLGTTRVINFHAETMVSWGFWLMVAAALVLMAGPWLVRFLHAAWMNTGEAAVVVAAVLAGFVLALVGAGSGGVTAAAAPALQAQIDAAAPGDTLTIPAGTYEGPITIDKPLTLIGEGMPIIDGQGQTDVVTVTAEHVTIRGFEIINSSRAVSTEPGGIRLSADHALIENNRLRDVLYGIIMVSSRDHVIRGNDVSSFAEEPTQRRGHAVYMYGSGGNLVEDNVLHTAKDGIFIGFADGNEIRDNHVSNVRYGIHFMYANDNLFQDNTFVESVAGAAIMYSTRIQLVGNEFANNRSTASGYGILLKDVDDILIKDNLIHHNRLGLTLEGAPQSPSAFVRFEDNLIGYNQVAIEATSTTHAVFVGNSFIGNLQMVEERGGDISNLNTWAENGRGNYWDTYQGYDANGDGIGDISFEYSGTYEALIEKNEALKAYRFSFAQVALDMTAKWFPVYEEEARVVDPAPLLSPTVRLSRDTDTAAIVKSAGIAAAMVAVPLAGFWFARSTFRRGWAPC